MLLVCGQLRMGRAPIALGRKGDRMAGCPAWLASCRGGHTSGPVPSSRTVGDTDGAAGFVPGGHVVSLSLFWFFVFPFVFAWFAGSSASPLEGGEPTRRGRSWGHCHLSFRVSWGAPRSRSCAPVVREACGQLAEGVRPRPSEGPAGWLWGQAGLHLSDSAATSQLCEPGRGSLSGPGDSTALLGLCEVGRERVSGGRCV